MRRPTVAMGAPSASAVEPDLTADQPQQTLLGIVPARVLQVLLSIIAALVLLGLLLPSHPIWLGRESATLGLLAARFDLDGEGNLPSYFSALQLLACGLVLTLFALQHRRTGSRWRHHWTVLACGFVYLSFDEAAQLHELLNCRPACR